MHPMLTIAVRAARKAGILIAKYYGQKKCFSIYLKMQTEEKNNNIKDKRKEGRMKNNYRSAQPLHGTA